MVKKKGAAQPLMTQHNPDENTPIVPSQLQPSKVAKVQTLANEVKDELEKTIESLVDREKNLDALVTKTEGLQQSSMDFRKKAGQVRNNMWWKDAKMKLVLGVLLAIILLIVILSIVLTQQPAK